MSWFAKLSKADQAGFRMFKCIMTGAAIGIVGREMYIRAIWNPRLADIDNFYKRYEGK